MSDTPVQFNADIPRLYDRHLGPVLFEPYARDMATRVAAMRPRRVLEVACGTGIVSLALHKALGEGVEIVATDLNAPMLDYARAKPGAASLDWRQADGTNLPFADDRFDATVCQFGYMFFPDKIAGFKEAARVLAPHGCLFFSVWSSLDENPSGRIPHEAVAANLPGDPPTFYRVPFSYHDEATIREHLAAAGFQRVTIERLVFDHEVPSAASVATGLVRGTPMFNALTERGADLDAIERDVARRFADSAGTSALTIRLDAKIVTARLQ